MERLRSLFSNISWGGNIIASFFLAGITILMTAGIISRGAFNKPFPGTFEIVGSSMAILTTIGFAYALRREMHIRATFLIERMSPKAQRIMLGVAYLFGFSITALLFSQLLMSAITSINIKEYTAGLVHVPIYVSRTIFAFAVLLFCLGYFFEAIDVLKGHRDGEKKSAKGDF